MTPSTVEGGQNGEERVTPPPQASEGQGVTEIEKALQEAGTQTHLFHMHSTGLTSPLPHPYTCTTTA